MTHPRVNHTGSGAAWCGPAALSVVTGLSTHQISRVIAANRTVKERAGARRHSKVIKGVYTYELRYMLDLLGVKYKSVHFPKRPTLGAILRDGGLDPEHFYIINITGHFVTIKGDRLIDNQHVNGIRALNYPRLKTKVKVIFEILDKDPTIHVLPPEVTQLLEEAYPAALPAAPAPASPTAVPALKPVKRVAYGPTLRGALADLLREGATRPEIAELTGWQPHTVRGWLSRLGKRYSMEVVGAGDARSYRIIAEWGQKEVDNDDE